LPWHFLPRLKGQEDPAAGFGAELIPRAAFETSGSQLQ
jgi:hypothetical protein